MGIQEEEDGQEKVRKGLVARPRNGTKSRKGWNGISDPNLVPTKLLETTVRTPPTAKARRMGSARPPIPK